MQVRQAAIADARRLYRFMLQRWRVAYRGQMPDAVLDTLMCKKRAIFWLTHLARQPLGILSCIER